MSVALRTSTAALCDVQPTPGSAPSSDVKPVASFAISDDSLASSPDSQVCWAPVTAGASHCAWPVDWSWSGGMGKVGISPAQLPWNLCAYLAQAYEPEAAAFKAAAPKPDAALVPVVLKPAFGTGLVAAGSKAGGAAKPSTTTDEQLKWPRLQARGNQQGVERSSAFTFRLRIAWCLKLLLCCVSDL